MLPVPLRDPSAAYDFARDDEGGLYLHNLGKHLWVLGRELGEDFTIEDHATLFEVAHEAGVAGAHEAGSGVDADLLEAAVVALL